jgi:hypothetical protein
MDRDDFIRITSAGSTMEANQILEVLKKQGVTAYKIGDTMDIYAGNATADEAIMVQEKDKDAALAALKDFTPLRTNSTGVDPTRSKRQTVINVILLTVIFLCILIPVLFLLAG